MPIISAAGARRHLHSASQNCGKPIVRIPKKEISGELKRQLRFAGKKPRAAHPWSGPKQGFVDIGSKRLSKSEILTLLLMVTSIVPDSAAGVRAGHTKRDVSHTSIPPIPPMPEPPNPGGSTVPPAASAAAPQRESIPIDRIEWRAFDEVKFLKDSGATVNTHDGLPGRLRAMRECFQPQTAAADSALDITQFNQTLVEQFVTGVMATLGYEQEPSAEIDPALSQNLFKRWFLQIASPQSGSGNGGGSVSPFNDALLRAMRPGSLQRNVCGDVENAKEVSPLPRIGALKAELRQQYLESYQWFDAGASQEYREWAFDGLCEIFEPAMARKDLPESFRYGSLEWTLLTIGIDLVGDAHMKMPYDRLILLGASADVFSETGDDMQANDVQADEDMLAFRQKCLQTILRMAHVQGKIDLLSKPEMTVEDVEIALTHFQSQSLPIGTENAENNPFKELVAGMQSRSDVAKEMVREIDLDPEQQFYVSERSTNTGTLVHQRLDRRVCAPGTVCTPLYKIFMYDWLDQLRFDRSLTGPEKRRLETLRHADLTARYEEGFNKILVQLEGDVMLPALQEQFESMSKEDEQFWLCGDWTASVVSARIRTDRRTSGIQGRSGIAPAAHPIIENKMRNAVLLKSTLMKNGTPETRRYWLTLEPFELRRYEGTDKALLSTKTNMNRFFKPLKDGDKLLELISSSNLHYENHSVQSAGEHPGKKIIHLLLRDIAAEMREAAREVTAPEVTRAERANFWKRLLLPFYPCYDSWGSDQAASDCTLDALAAGSFAFAGAKLGRTMFSLGRHMSKSQIRSAAAALVAGSVNKKHAHNSISTILKLEKPAKAVGAAAVGVVDPGVGLAYGLLSGGARVLRVLRGPAVRRMLEKMRGFPGVESLMTEIRQAKRLFRKTPAESGFRRAAPNAPAPSNNRQVAGIESTAHRTPQDDAVDLVETIQNNAGRRHRPAPPAQRTVVRQKPLCREKRAGDNGHLPSCAVALKPDLRFSRNGYAPEAVAPVYKLQLSVMRPDNADAAQRVNLAGVGFSQSRFIASTASWQAQLPNARDFDNVGTGSTASLGAVKYLPEKISAKIVTHADAAGSAEYVAISFNENRDGVTYWNRQYMPFASYQDADGTRVGIVAMGNRHYCFRVDKSKVLTETDNRVELTLARPDEMYKFRRYQALSEYEFNGPDVNYDSVVRLRDCPPEVQQRFDGMMADTAKMLNDVIDVLDHHPDVANQICGRFSASAEQTSEIIKVFRNRVERMKESLPYLNEQREHVIGFYTNPKGKQHNHVLGESLWNSMTEALDFAHINKPLILLNSRYLRRQQPGFNLAGLLAHEYSHAFLGTRDDVKGGAPFYAKREGNSYDLQSLIDTLKPCTAEEALSHAPFFEHLTVMFSSWKNPAMRGGIVPFIKGQSSYLREASLPAERAAASESAAASTSGRVTLDDLKKAYEADLCRTKRAGDTPSGACGLIPDPRFGPHGYSRQTAFPLKNYQVSLSDASLSQAPREFNALDLGYATYVERPSGARIDVVPEPTAPDLPETIVGHIESLPSKTGGAPIDYAVLTIVRPEDAMGATTHTTQYVPFGTYRERDGTVVAIAYVDPYRPYSFRVDASRIPLAGQHPAITLKRAAVEETDKFWCFQKMLSTDQRIDNPLVAGAVKLRDETADVKARFEVVFEHAQRMLNDAIKAMESEQLSPLVAQMGAKLLGMEVGTELYAALNNIWAHLTKMRDSLPYLKEQSPHVIGFFEGAQASEGPIVLANTFLKGLAQKISFADVNKPVMAFERGKFMDPHNVVNNQAATLLHEGLHAFEGLLDQMNPASVDPLYAPLDHETADLSVLTAAARQPGSKPENHAPTVEHFLVMADAVLHDDTRDSVLAFIKSGIFRRGVTADDFTALLQDPIFDSLDPLEERQRRKRATPPYPVPVPVPNVSDVPRSDRAAGKLRAAKRFRARPLAPITSAQLRSSPRPS